MAKMKVMTPRKTLCIILLPPAVLASDASDTFEPLRGAAWKKAPDGSISLFPSSAHVHLDRSIDRSHDSTQSKFWNGDGGAGGGEFWNGEARVR